MVRGMGARVVVGEGKRLSLVRKGHTPVTWMPRGWTRERKGCLDAVPGLSLER